MRGADAWAGTIKSGGKTRRAAKMVVLDVDHPDILDFIWCKAREEEKAAALRDAGFDMRLDSEHFASIQYQNANNSVRVSDEFMERAERGEEWELTARTDGSVLERVNAREVLHQIADAAWRCADPGVQYDTTIQNWHTNPNSGRISTSNPCSEYLSVDDSACNLASLNLMKFRREDGTFDVETFEHVVDVVFLAQEIIISPSSYPTEEIGKNARDFRQIGLGYANLGALLMANGVPYDSDAGRELAGAITALMTGRAYRRSAEIARDATGPYARYAENRDPHNHVMRKHRDAAYAAERRASVTRSCCRQRARRLGRGGRSWVTNTATGTHRRPCWRPTGCLVEGSLVPTSRGLVRLRSLGDTDRAAVAGPRRSGRDRRGTAPSHAVLRQRHGAGGVGGDHRAATESRERRRIASRWSTSRATGCGAAWRSSSRATACR